MDLKVLLITFFIFFQPTQVLGCYIKSYDHIVKTFRGENFNQTIKSSDCNKIIQDKFKSFIKNNSGIFNSRQLSLYLKTPIKVHPKKINIYSLDQFLKNQFPNKDYRFRQTKVIGQSGPILFDSQQFPLFKCDQCSSPGNIHFSLHQPENEKTIWANSLLEVATTAFVSLGNISFNQSHLSASLFKKKTVYTAHPERVFNKFKNIRFFKLNKNIKQDHILKTSDLSSGFLVKIGQPVNVFFHGNGVKLSSPAIALKSGRLGELIQLKGINDKKIFAIVTGFNKAKISL